jgi:hypothetical protein
VSELKKSVPAPGSPSPDAKGYRDLAQAAFSKQDSMTWIALAMSVTGERDKAFDYLDKALSAQEIELVLCVRYPTLDPIRSDPRYKTLVSRLGLPE